MQTIATFTFGANGRYIERKLKLKINADKSAVARPQERKFLGFSFTGGCTPKRRIAPQALNRLKKRIRTITKRTRGIGLERLIEDLSQYLSDGGTTLASVKPRRC